MPNVGDRVKVTTEKSKEEGILMPSLDSTSILIKLDNGYNVGFKSKEVKSIEVLEKAKSKTKQMDVNKDHNPLPDKFKDSFPTISILHTGGTIASKVDYRTGGVTASFNPEEIITMFPELKSIAHINSELIFQMWSDDLRFKHLSVMAHKIEEHINAVKNKIKGIIISIGTDNLAVAAATLSFMVEKTPIPIILVGAQRSSDRGSSDAGMNLICAAEFIVKTYFSGVAICMHGSAEDNSCVILPAGKTYKLHSSRRDAFQAVNARPIARVNYNTREIQFLQKDYSTRSKGKDDELIIKPKMEEKVGLLKIHINMFPEQFELFKSYKGLVIEGTGLGHTPGQDPNSEVGINKEIFSAIKKIIDSGCIVVMTTQCLFGNVNMNVYDKGRDLLNIGVISGKDMLANTALVKLSWLLGNYSPEEARQLVGKNLRGEINERVSYEQNFLNYGR